MVKSLHVLFHSFYDGWDVGITPTGSDLYLKQQYKRALFLPVALWRRKNLIYKCAKEYQRMQNELPG